MKWLKTTKESSRSRQRISGAATTRTPDASSNSILTSTTEAGTPEKRSPTTDEAGELYADFINGELNDARASKTSIEQRGIAVVSTSGILVALLFGFSAVARHGAAIEIPSNARIWFYLALGAFAIAAALALLVNVPRGYRAPKAKALGTLVVDRWDEPPRVARRRVTATRVRMYESYRRGNKRKGILLMCAIGAEVFAVTFLAVAIGLVVSNS